MSAASEHDFIEVYPNTFSADFCQLALSRFESSGQAKPGRVGSGVFPELKDSRDITLAGKADWQDIEQAFNQAVFGCLLQYLRKYCFTLISPLMLQLQDAVTGKPRRIVADDFPTMDDAQLAGLAGACFRPGAINLQHYRADSGGYPYWHCELYPKDASCEPLHRHLLWTVYLNDNFAEGETEFFYQQRKIQPQRGALLLAPAGFTHTHRGNRPRGGDKYIATSWVLFNRAEQLFGAPA